MSLVALLVLLTLQGASSIDVPVEIGFEFSGLHSDFAQQYYVLYTELDETAQLSDVSSSALPSDLRQELSTNSLSWGDLPGLLQRAFIWDAGYVLTPTHGLAKVYTRCGRSMAELVVPPKAFERAGCQLRECSLPDGTIFHRSLDCKASQLSRAVQCAVDAADDISAPAYAAVWGDGGEADTLPEVTVQRHAYLDTDGKPNLIFALHTTNYEVAYTQCPLTPAMVIPCAPYNLVNQSKFCTPEPGEVASTWLTKYAADHKQDKTWLLVPLCIVTFVTFGTVAVYRYKSALRDEARREVDLFMRENRHLFDNGAVEAFLVPKRRGKSRSRSSRTQGSSRQHRSSSYSSSSSIDSEESAYSSRSSIRSRDSDLDRSEASLSYTEGVQNAAAFEHFDATIGLSASAFDPLASAVRINPLQNDAQAVTEDNGASPDEVTARKNEMAIRSFRLFESHRKIRRLRVPISELQLLRPLSHGSTGEVWLALHNSSQVAIKQLVPEKRRSLPEMEMFLAEIYLMAQLKHPHIVTMTGIAWNTLEHVIMIQEYMEGGDLQHFLAQQRTNNTPSAAPVSSGNTIVRRSRSMSGGLPQVDEAAAVSATSSGSFAGGLGAAAGSLIHSTHSSHFTWTKQKLAIAQAVTSALAYLHALTPMVLHRDVKSRNVLLSSSLDAKLCDFGISRRKCSGNDDETNLTATAAAGTLSWTAPELLLGEEYTEKVDIYSLGVLLSELDTCTLPYHDPASISERLVQHPLRLMRRIIDDGLRPQLSPDCPLPITHLIAACVSRNPNLRPSAADVGAWLASARGERLLRKSSSVLIP
ncbi:putative serine/threonine-protein kinase/receptor [Phytophthora citrophthora]|uniref:Serine/threonine-protein kinase/receptor n=1 Tax=Phytophthora citrophthora TaxID=4793 RepID=A0AAD9G486_9STRA|nr:putative serine/threonine-protein kinase/receptor [Phytophthora citrophthora]